MTKISKNLFESVFLPAVAGNILWTLFTMMLDCITVAELPRLAMLLILAYYVVVDWLLYKLIDASQTSFRYWLFESFYLLAVTVTALSAQLAPIYLRWFLTGYFVIVILGHVCNAWEAGESSGMKRGRLITANIVGVAVLWIGQFYFTWPDWSIPLSFAFALVLWLIWARGLKSADIASKIP
ncbi:hypothetical protein ACEQ6A_10745 [Rhizobium brockwellii]|uniref:hypothetical protein n=1 Tax=Rhizobium brockwellii TaxID=3019932 RepID=UPI003F9AE733